jgi:DNA polymerase-3 subunit gamma/tau
MKRSLYREYRPQSFSELVGQDHVARTLRNAVETDTVAHAYIFAGPRGTGKTSTARILAKALDCIGPDGALDHPTATPCGVCRHCVAIAAGTSLDVIEMDAASNRSIDDVRDLRDKIAFAPVEGRSKVYIIDEVHMLTREAFNALLKTLEEPPPNVVFVLATTEPHKIPETIVSRCQRFDFRRPQVRDIAALLASIVERENARPDEERGGPRIEIQDAALEEIARHSQGGFRDAIGTLEKLITYSDGAIRPVDVLEALGVTDADLLFEITDIVADRRPAEALQFVQRLANEGADYAQFMRDLLRHLRQLFLLQHLEESARDAAVLRALGQTVELDEQLLERLLPQANSMAPREVVYFIETLGEAQREIRDGLDPRLQLELALVKVTRPHLDHSAAALEERLRRLETAAAHGHVAAEPAPAATPESSAPPAAAPRPATRAAKPQQPAAPAPEPAVQSEPAPDAASEAAQAGTEPDAPPDATPAAPPGPSPDAEAADAAEAAPELTVDRIRRAWELVLQRVQTGSVGLYALLRDARPHEVRGDTLAVGMPSEFSLAQARYPGNDEILAEALEAVLGRRLHTEFVLTPGAAASTPKPNPAAVPDDRGTLDFTDLIKQAKGTFDAEEMPDDS